MKNFNDIIGNQTFWLVAQRINHLHHCMPHIVNGNCNITKRVDFMKDMGI